MFNRIRAFIRKKFNKNLSYHDVKVFIDGKEYAVHDSYGYELTCTRCAGWRLWWRPMGNNKPPTLLGGEYDNEYFRIEVAGKIICG